MSKASDACSVVAADQMLARKLKRDLKSDCDTVIAGVRHWSRPNNSATGQAVTLYERHPHTAEHAGNPIADTFAIVARKNSAILVLGDGVNWGPKAALASRCAVFACIDHLNTAIFGEVPTVKNTQVRTFGHAWSVKYKTCFSFFFRCAGSLPKSLEIVSCCA